MMKRNLFLVCLLAFATPSVAITVNGAPPAAGKGVPPSTTSVAMAQAARDDSAGLRKGTVEAVNVSGGSFSVYGQKMSFDPTRVKVFGRDGKPTNAYAMRAGGKLRFTMDATDPMHRRVAVIYVE
jgi:hypothetical protein